MVLRTCVVITACVTLSMVFLTSKVKAITKTSNVDEYLIKDRRTHTRQNYVVQKALENALGENDNIGVPYDVEPLDPETSPEDLPALVVDYANMIRNDIILLDNSVETRTRKRGNIKVEKHNQILSDTPCNCEQGREIKYMGEKYFPRELETRKCDQKLCSKFYYCKENVYNLTVLRKKTFHDSSSDVASDVSEKWVAVGVNVTVGCVCSRDYVEPAARDYVEPAAPVYRALT